MMLRPAALLLVLGLHALQDDAAERAARGLIEKLRSDSIDERDSAMRQLKALGRAAKGELEKAAKDRDAEVARRVAFLLRAIELADQFSPQILKLIPNLDDRLAAGGDAAWTEAFKTVLSTPEGLDVGDLRRLAGPALRGASGPDERRIVCDAIAGFRLQEALPELLRLARAGTDQNSHFLLKAFQSLDRAPVRAGLTALLCDEHGPARHLACTFLGSMGERSAAPLIAKLLEDPEQEVRFQAHRSILKLGATETAPQLVRLLGHKDPRDREMAAATLGGLEAREAIPALAALLSDASPEVRGSAVRTLMMLQAREAAPRIEALAADPDPDVQASVAWALGVIGAKGSAARLVPLLKSADIDVRLPAAWAMGRFRHREAIPDLVRLLSDEDEEIRAFALQALGAMDAREAAREIVLRLSDADADVRMTAAWAAGRLRLKEAVPALLKLLEANGDDVQRAAALALGRMGAVDALPLFLTPRPARPKGLELRPGVEAALRDFPAREVLPLALKLLEKGKDERPVAAAALRALRAPEAREPLSRLLKDLDDDVRGPAARGLGELGAREAIPDLLALLRDESSDAQGAAGLALALLGADDALPDLRRLVRDSSRSLEGDVVRALELFGDSESRDFVIASLSDLSYEGILAAARWLCREGRRVVIQPLLDEAELYTALNGLRRPEAWKRLHAKTLAGRLEGTLLDIAERIGAEAGFEIEWRFEDTVPDTSILLERRLILNGDGRMTAADALLELMQSTGSDYEAIVEADRIRILPFDDAERFWERWAEEELKKK